MFVSYANLQFSIYNYQFWFYDYFMMLLQQFYHPFKFAVIVFIYFEIIFTVNKPRSQYIFILLLFHLLIFSIIEK